MAKKGIKYICVRTLKFYCLSLKVIKIRSITDLDRRITFLLFCKSTKILAYCIKENFPQTDYPFLAKNVSTTLNIHHLLRS